MSEEIDWSSIGGFRAGMLSINKDIERMRRKDEEKNERGRGE